MYLWLAKKTCALHEILTRLVNTENAFSVITSHQKIHTQKKKFEILFSEIVPNLQSKISAIINQL